MIKNIKLINFFSFGIVNIPLSLDANILIGINGSGKSNLFKALNLLKIGVSGIGLKKYLLDNLGGFDNILFKGKIDKNSNDIIIEYTFDGKAITEGKYGFRFTEAFDFFEKMLFPELTNAMNSRGNYIAAFYSMIECSRNPYIDKRLLQTLMAMKK
jgi:predicted ATPase